MKENRRSGWVPGGGNRDQTTSNLETHKVIPFPRRRNAFDDLTKTLIGARLAAGGLDRKLHTFLSEHGREWLP
jgi:hypothetical protein